MNVFWYIILLISLTLNFLVLRYDFIPLVYSKIKRKFFANKIVFRNTNQIESDIVKKSSDTIKKVNSVMVWSEPLGLGNKLNSLRGVTNKKSFRNYNYPRALIFNGLTAYASIKQNENLFSVIETEFNKLIDEEGNPTFLFNKVDQVSFGLTSLLLWEKTKEKKYIRFANYIFRYIHNNYLSHDGVILYRDKSLIWLNDMLGLVIPFLTEYSRYSQNTNSLMMAKEQMSLFIQYGTDYRTFMPSHGVDLTSKIMIGSANWGRGIGWYFIGLKTMYEFDGSFEKEYFGLSDTLMKLRNKEGLWSQFPGSSETFDASTTTMFLYCLPKKYFTKEEILTKLNKYISKDGFILQTSGDTYGANSYSKTFGKSELSQGMLMAVLSRYN